MKAAKMIALAILIAVSMVPGLLNAQVVSSREAESNFQEEEIRQFIDRYVDRYKAKDIDQYMALFSEKAVENRMYPYADIRPYYKKVFGETGRFEYYVNLYSIQRFKSNAFAAGRYKIIQTLKGGNDMRTFQGNIQWILIREDGSLKIRELNYGLERQTD